MLRQKIRKTHKQWYNSNVEVKKLKALVWVTGLYFRLLLTTFSTYYGSISHCSAQAGRYLTPTLGERKGRESF